MLFVLGTLASFIVYVGGLVIVTKVTPLLLPRRFDEGWFMLIAAADIVGGIFIFAAVMVTFALFGNVFIKVVDFLLLVGALIVAVRMSFRSFRPRSTADTFLVSRVLAGSYCALLGVAAIYIAVLLFLPAA